jgi:hypothetical protein
VPLKRRVTGFAERAAQGKGDPEGAGWLHADGVLAH